MTSEDAHRSCGRGPGRQMHPRRRYRSSTGPAPAAATALTALASGGSPETTSTGSLLAVRRVSVSVPIDRSLPGLYQSSLAEYHRRRHASRPSGWPRRCIRNRSTTDGESTSAAWPGNRQSRRPGALAPEARPPGSVYQPASAVEPAPAAMGSVRSRKSFWVVRSWEPDRLESQEVAAGEEEEPAAPVWFSSGAYQPPEEPEGVHRPSRRGNIRESERLDGHRHNCRTLTSVGPHTPKRMSRPAGHSHGTRPAGHSLIRNNRRRARDHNRRRNSPACDTNNRRFPRETPSSSHSTTHVASVRSPTSPWLTLFVSKTAQRPRCQTLSGGGLRKLYRFYRLFHQYQLPI